MARAVSDLGSPGAVWAPLMNFAFMCTGLMIVLFGCTFVSELGATPASVCSTMFWSVAGLCLLGVGVVPFPHPHHVEIAFYGAVFSCAGILAGHFAIFAVSRAYLLWVLSPVAASSTLLFLCLPIGPVGRQGLWERAFLVSVGLWQALAAIHIWKASGLGLTRAAADAGRGSSSGQSPPVLARRR